MALIFGLWAECRDDTESCEAFAAHFAGLEFQVCGGVTIRWQASTDRTPYVHVWSHDLGTTGPESLQHAARVTDAGIRLYVHLSNAPDFHFALFGLEVDRYDHADVLDEMCGDGMHSPEGLVISNQMWLEAAKPKHLLKFRDGYFWRPYRGESVSPLYVGEFRDELWKLYWKLPLGEPAT